MHELGHAIFVAGRRDEILIRDVTDDQRGVNDGFPTTEFERIQYHDVATGLAERAHGVRPDVAGAAGDEHGTFGSGHGGDRIERASFGRGLPQVTAYR